MTLTFPCKRSFEAPRSWLEPTDLLLQNSRALTGVRNDRTVIQPKITAEYPTDSCSTYLHHSSAATQGCRQISQLLRDPHSLLDTRDTL